LIVPQFSLPGASLPGQAPLSGWPPVAAKVYLPWIVTLVVDGPLPAERLYHLDALVYAADPTASLPFLMLRHAGVWWWRASAAFPQADGERTKVCFFCVAHEGLGRALRAIDQVEGIQVKRRTHWASGDALADFCDDWREGDRPQRRLPLAFAKEMRLDVAAAQVFRGSLRPPYAEDEDADHVPVVEPVALRGGE
jgi:hypothetical protein